MRPIRSARSSRAVTSSPLQLQREGALLTVFTDVVDERLQLAAQFAHVTVTIGLNRDDVRQLATALDEWLFDSRPA